MGNTLKVIVTGASYERMEIEVIPYTEASVNTETGNKEEE